uniref:Olfactory receptor C family, r1 n=1 Tax=Labrus bergylta TaxID=56723 RepID=A0A3Q3L6Q0_9LABR
MLMLPLLVCYLSLEHVPLQYIYAMVFAVEEINNSTTLLQGVKLGYSIFDSCGRPPWALQAALSQTGGDSTSCILNDTSDYSISYLASCPCLSDRLQFPNFFRTIPSDIYQARAIAQLAIRFNWNWIGAVVANNDYGHMAVKVFCFIDILSMSAFQIYIQYTSIIHFLVILIFSWYTDVRELFLQLAKINVTWSTSNDLLQDMVTRKVANGVLGVAIRSSTMPGFQQYLSRLNPISRPGDDFLREFWEKEFGCSLEAYSLPPCSGTESLERIRHPFTDISQLRVTYNVYLAVYAAAHALHSLLSCPDMDSLIKTNTSTCSSLKLMKPIKSIEVNIPPKYDLVNWQKTTGGSQKLVLIGGVDGFDLHLDDSAIQWSTGSNQVPISVCNESCPPGTRKANRKGEPLCCFDCIPCADGEISNETGSLHCERCPSEFWSNDERTACILRQLDFLSFNETLGITLTTVAASGVVVTTAVFVVFLCYHKTPMVRANNSELSFLLLLSLKLCFLCSLVFIGRPSIWSCRFGQAAFGISFVLCVSCLQVKTIVVLAAFRSARPGAGALIRWFGPSQQRGSVCLLTCIQIIICTTWLSISPPVPRRDLGFQGSKVTLECAMASVVGFSLVLGYIGLLACTCLLLAFLARKLPDNFNEAKLITFSMLIFCAVWVAFVPAYVSSSGKYTVAVEIFAILASSYGLLLCIFTPKCFIIVFRPEKNTKKNLMTR